MALRRGTAAGSVLDSSIQASRAAHRTMFCLGLPHACVPSQRALHVHQPAIACFRWHRAAAQTSSSFISDKVELNSFEEEYDPKLQAASPFEWCVRWSHVERWTMDKVASFVRVFGSVSGSATSKEVCW